MAKSSPTKTISKLVEFFEPQLEWLKKTAAERSVKKGQFVSVNELIRELVQKAMLLKN